MLFKPPASHNNSTSVRPKRHAPTNVVIFIIPPTSSFRDWRQNICFYLFLYDLLLLHVVLLQSRLLVCVSLVLRLPLLLLLVHRLCHDILKI